MKRVHYAWNLHSPGLCNFAYCGRWTKQLTEDRSEVTCPRCIARYDAEALARVGAQKKETP